MTKKTKKNNKGIIIGICAAIAAIVVIVAVVLCLTLGNKKIDESFFVSDNTKYVLTLNSEAAMDDYDLGEFAPNKMHLVFFYSGDNVTGLKMYYEYNDEETVKQAVNYIKEELDEDETLKSVSSNGKYVIIEADESLYKDMTAEEAKQQIQLMEMLQNMEFDDSFDLEIE